ncbi:MAG: hypothetical protein HYV97_19170 [Bdellovibrio sp.]|nr:hypothetical protein [Bdellovibrio sp.]
MKKLFVNPQVRFMVILISFYAGILLAAFVLLPENLAFKGPNPNPYYILALIFASFYGIAEAAIAIVAANILFFSLLYLQADFEAIETIFDLSTVMTASLFSVLAIFIGELRTMGKVKLANLRETLNQKEKVLHLMTNEFENNLKNSEELKAKLLSKIDTFSILYNDSKKLNAFDMETIFDGLLSILSKHLSASKYGIYFSREINDEVFHLIQGIGDYLPNEINFSHEQNPQIAKIMSEKQCLAPNDIWSKTDFNSLNGQILMGAPIMIRGVVRGMVLVYELPFLKYVPFNFKLFEIYVKWASESLEKALHFQHIEKLNIVNKDYDIYKWQYFCDRLEEEFDRSRNYRLPLSIARIDISALPSDQREIVLVGLIEVAKNRVRKMDCLAEGPTLDHLYILMPIADEDVAYGKLQEIQEHFPADTWTKIKVGVTSFTSEMQSSFDLIRGMAVEARALK